MTRLYENRLFDCFIFNNELDLLEIRLNELADTVDTFVLVESPQTFSGIPKPLTFAEHKADFLRFDIRHIIFDEFIPTKLGGWDQTPCHTNERNQRNAIMRGLDDCAPGDVIWLSDLDEIPDPKMAELGSGFVFNMNVYIYFLNYLLDQRAGGTTSILYKDITTPNEVMLARSWGPFRDGGWHFSYMGGATRISNKLQAICHQEYNTDYHRNTTNIKQRIGGGGSIFTLPDRAGYAQYGWDWPEDDKLIRLVKIDDTFPRYLVENREKFDYLIADSIEDVWKDKFN